MAAPREVEASAKSLIGTAIRYAMNQWRELGRFLDDAGVPLDNNASEASLRRVALGRKNFLFVGDVHAGMSIAGLYDHPKRDSTSCYLVPGRAQPYASLQLRP